MSLMFPHKSTREIRENYNALGLLWLVPVYIYLGYDELNEKYFVEGVLEEANWVPRPLFWMAIGLSAFLASILNMLGREPALPIIVIRTW